MGLGYPCQAGGYLQRAWSYSDRLSGQILRPGEGPQNTKEENYSALHILSELQPMCNNFLQIGF
jgi:hypothetical protein